MKNVLSIILSIKSAILQRKHLILANIVLLIIIIVLFNQNQQCRLTLFYRYQTIPDVDLTNTLTMTPSGWSGQVTGFVKLDDPTDQPTELRQYYVIKPLNNANKNSRQRFLLETIVKLPYLPPKSLGILELTEASKTDHSIILKDDYENLFIIDLQTKQVFLRDVDGDSGTLITSNEDYKNFVKKQVKK